MLASRSIRPADAERLWQATLGRLELEMTTPNFVTWLEGTRAVLACDGELVVEARSAFASEWLNGRLRPLVERVVQLIAGEVESVRFVAPGTAPEVGAPRPVPALEGPPRLVGTLNEGFTFERYLETEGNLVARDTCLGLVEGSALAMSPVVVHAAPGQGKSHLLHATGHEALARGWAVACMSAEQFTNRYQAAVRDKDASGFQQALRGVRLFILDDLQYLEQKTGTANELVHTIDAVTNAGGHVIVASERPPAEMRLPERLKSRLTSGLVTCIDPFRPSERRAFIEAATGQCGAAFPAWVVDRLAALETPSVRVLRGALTRALALARCERLTPDQLDRDLMATALAQRTAQAPANETDRLLERVAQLFEVAVSDLVGRSRKREVSEARAVAAAMLRERGLSLAEAAQVLGGRDRSTIRQLAERGRVIVSEDDAARQLLAG